MIKLFLLTSIVVAVMLSANIGLYSFYGGGSIIGAVFNTVILYKPWCDMFYGTSEWLNKESA